MKKSRKSVKSKKQKNRKYFSPSTLIISLVVAVAVVLPVIMVLSLNKQNNNKSTFASTPTDRYGISGHLVGLSTTDLNRSLDDYKALGVQWVRDDFDWPSIQSNNASSYDWTAHDAFVTAAAARGIKVLGIIDYTPQWELPSGCTDMYHCPPKNNTDYAAFAAALAQHYAPMGVHTWELWNEPNGGTFTVANYTAMIKAAYPAIKNADPTAFVLAGSTEPAATSGTSYSPIDFLTGIYQNGGKAYFDGVSHHPYCYDAVAGGFNCPTAFASWSAWSQMQDTNPSLRSVMTANGDQNKQIWATEFGAPTAGTSTDTPPVTETKQAQMVTDAYTLFSSYSWSGPLFWYTYQDPCTTTTDIECYFGLVRTDYSHKPAYDAYKSLTNTITATQTPTVTLIPTVTITPTVTPKSTVTPTLKPTATFTPTPIPASVKVTSLSEQGSSSRNPLTFNFTLQTSGTLLVNSLIVATRDQNNNNLDSVVKTNFNLTGKQSLNISRSLSIGTYTYWIAYNKNGVWTNLAPVKTFQINRR